MSVQQTRRRRPMFVPPRLASIRFDAAHRAGSVGSLSGYAIVWNVLSDDRGGYRIRLMPGSARFASVVHALWQHEYRDVLGGTDSGTLRLRPDDVGVRFALDLPNTTAGRDVAELVRTRRVRGMSFAMVDEPKGRRVTEGGTSILNAENYLVDEITITPIPAFVQASVSEVTDGAAPLVGYDGPAGVPVFPMGFRTRAAHALRLSRAKLDAVAARRR